MKVLVTPTSFKPEHPSEALARLQGFADEIVFNPYGRPLQEEEVAELLDGCSGYIAGLDFITKKALASQKTLKVISRYGAGVDRVDIAAAKEMGIAVCNTPGANASAVADLALGLMLCVARQVPKLDSKTKQGEWVRSTGVELFGKTIGILGLGAIGKGVAQRAQGFAMKVLAYDPFIDTEYTSANNIQAVTFDELIKSCDVISLHLPLNDETRHIMGRDTLAQMKQGAILINTARGGLIDESAAYDLLVSGHLGGLGLDAYEQEPPGESPLFKLDNVVATPHTASHTREATQNMANMAVDNLINVLSGNLCKHQL